jgi:hypothetical protein
MLNTILNSRFFILAITTFVLISKTMGQDNLGLGTASPNASAKLDVNSTTQGMLVPRMTALQRSAIANPATGLFVYQIDGVTGFYLYNGSIWTNLSGAVGAQGSQGPQGVQGPQGPAGVDGIGVPAGGTTGQLLTKVNATDYNSNWVTATATASGAKMVWEATASIPQTFAVGFSFNFDVGCVRFDNDIIGPTNNSNILNDSIFVVGETGLYCLTAHVTVQLTGTNLASLAPFFDIRNASGGNIRRYVGTSVSNSATLPPESRGRGYVTVYVNLTAGETVRVKVNNTSTTIQAPITTNGTTRVTVVKL